VLFRSRSKSQPETNNLSLQQAIEQQKNNAVQAVVITEESKNPATIAEPQDSSDENSEEKTND